MRYYGPGISATNTLTSFRCEERYNKGKMVASIMRHVAKECDTPMEELYSHIGWPLNKKYGNALDAFKMSITEVVITTTFLL